MKYKAIISLILAISLCFGLCVTASAAINPFAAMEAKSQQALSAAIKAGTVPEGTTIYDCAYTAGADGVTVVIKYRDKNDVWHDVTTGKPAVQPSVPAVQQSVPTVADLTAENLEEYADEVFRLTNKERVKGGREPLERDPLMDEAAMIRASEIKAVDEAGGKPHTRLDGTSFATVFDDLEIEGKLYGENLARAEASPKNAVDAWMKSTKGHRENMLRERFDKMGVGVYQREDGRLNWIQLFIDE